MSAMQNNLREMQVIGVKTQEWIIHERDCPSLTTLGIRYTGITQAGDGFAFCRLKPNMAIIFGTLSGKGKVWIQGEWKTCGSGDLYLTPAGVPHAYRSIPGKKWHLGWVVYGGGNEHTLVRDEEPQLRRGPCEGLFTALRGLYDEVHGLNESPALHRWAELIDLSARRLIQEHRMDERLRELWSQVDTELSRDWTLELLAQKVHLSGEQLRWLCQKYFNHSPMEHLTSLRMKRAAVLLVRTNQKIAVIAEDVGYKNAFAFSTAFKRVVGVSPLEFSRAEGRRIA